MTRKALGGITDDMFCTVWGRTDITLRTVARTLNISRGAIHYHAKRLGLPRRGSVNRMKVSPEEFASVWSAGVSITEIAEHYGYSSADTVSVKRARMGLPPRSHGGNHRPITMVQYLETELSKRMLSK